MKRTLRAAMIALVAAMAVLSSSPVPASAAPPNLGFLGRTEIWNHGLPGKCLDAFYGDGGGNGNRVGMWDCNGGITEKWDVYGVLGPNGYEYQILNARNRRSLDYPASSGGQPGWQYELWDSVGSPGQRFVLSCTPPPPVYTSCYIYVAISQGPVQVMDAYASDGGGNGNRVGTWPRNGSSLQTWSLPGLVG